MKLKGSEKRRCAEQTWGHGMSALRAVLVDLTALQWTALHAERSNLPYLDHLEQLKSRIGDMRPKG